MQFSILSTLLFSLLLQGVAAAPADVSSNSVSAAEKLQEGYAAIVSEDRKPPSNTSDTEAVVKRDHCNFSQGITRSDVVALSNELMNNSPWTWSYLEHGWVRWWTWGSARICLYNDYWFENTHVSRFEGGWAAEFIMNSCGYDGSGRVRGGQATAHGDSGLSLRAELRNAYNTGC
ncbi:hypothetical protein QBC44DRAFT_402435 [Cladorrhinum sp. PSN332]|nr:hypothetical protein QBC44DRAFT_402435 [Cladorrhinum sp. PSN332]